MKCLVSRIVISALIIGTAGCSNDEESNKDMGTRSDVEIHNKDGSYDGATTDLVADDNGAEGEVTTLEGVWEILTIEGGGVEKSFEGVKMEITDDETCDLLIDRVTSYAKVLGSRMYFYHKLSGVAYMGGYNGEGTNGDGLDNPAYFQRVWATEDIFFAENSADKTVTLGDDRMVGKFSGTESALVLNIQEGIGIWTLKKVDASMVAGAVDEPDGLGISMDSSHLCLD